MSLLSKIKKILKKKNEQQQETIELKTIEDTEDQPVSEVEKLQISEFNDVENAIKDWEKTLDAVKQHPLSQVKIVNTRILEDLSNVLKSMDSKLENLNKLDRIMEMLLEARKELEEKGADTSVLDNALNELDSLTIKDKEVIEWVSKQGKVTANELADFTGLSRSTASFRLNRLSEMGVLEKEADGKKIYYKPKDI